ncbi:MAG: hypothetical protein K1X64_10935 [Myxococcaceae bacterium]|nr:hypothetical protein [Myxococcaceae bacterium]
MSGTVTGMLLAAAWTFQYRVFHLPVLLSVVVAGVVCNLAFLVTLSSLARRHADNRWSAVRVLLTWAVICPFIAALVAWLVHGLDYEYASMTEELTHAAVSNWSFAVNSHFITQAATQALLGVGCAAWLLLRASVRRSLVTR